MPYKIIDALTGDIVSPSCDLREAVHLLLTANGYEYEIRRDPGDLFTFVLWRRYPENNDFAEGWYPTKIDTVECDITKATIDIFHKVLDNPGWFPDRIALVIREANVA